MTLPIIPPFAIAASYQKEQMAQGTYVQGGSQVFSHLVSPPSTGVAAETASNVKAQAVGFTGYSAANEVQLVTVNGTPTGGTFKLEWGAAVTSVLQYNATAAQIQSALNALASAPVGTGGTNEVQTATITGTPTGGTFTLTYSGQTTSALAYNATAAQVQAALLALSNIGTGQLAVTGATGGPFTITFGGTLAKTDVAALTATASLTGGSTPGVTIATPTAGVASTPSITVSGSAGGPWTVTFANTLAGVDVAPLVATAVSLTGGTNPYISIATNTRGRKTFVNKALQRTYSQGDAMVDFYDSAGGNHI